MKVEELIEDSSFIAWVEGDNESVNDYWEEYSKNNPHQIDTIEIAKDLVKGIKFKTPTVSNQEIDAQFLFLKNQIEKKNTSYKLKWIGYAASIVLLISLGTYFLVNPSVPDIEWTTITSGPGEIRKIPMSDGSVITLNGNSEIKVPLTNFEINRQVYLQGEAYFEVEKMRDASVFEVITKEGVITVLGTKFNIKARPKSSIVSLYEGSIAIENTLTRENKIIEPGYTASLTEKSLVVKEDKSMHYLNSWKDNVWEFHNSNLSDVLVQIEESFNTTIENKEKLDLDKKISGRISTNSLKTLLKAFDALFGIILEENGDTLTIKSDLK